MALRRVGKPGRDQGQQRHLGGIEKADGRPRRADPSRDVEGSAAEQEQTEVVMATDPGRGVQSAEPGEPNLASVRVAGQHECRWRARDVGEVENDVGVVNEDKSGRIAGTRA